MFYRKGKTENNKTLTEELTSCGLVNQGGGS
jgi:hypothetical protein